MNSNRRNRAVAAATWRAYRFGWTILAAGSFADPRVCRSIAYAQPSLHFPLAEGAAHGFPEMHDQQGRNIADAEFIQIPDGDRLHVRLTYRLGDGRTIEEDTVVRQRPALIQDSWQWQEMRASTMVRRFSMDFSTGAAQAEKIEHGERKQWRKELKIEPGRTFAGFAFTLALECLRAEPGRGSGTELSALAFTPHPRLVTVKIAYAGVDAVLMAGRRIEGDEFIIRPEIPAIVRPFIAAPDTKIWLIHSEPTGFLRWEGPLAEPDDEIVVVDLLPTATK